MFLKKGAKSVKRTAGSLKVAKSGNDSPKVSKSEIPKVGRTEEEEEEEEEESNILTRPDSNRGDLSRRERG